MTSFSIHMCIGVEKRGALVLALYFAKYTFITQVIIISLYYLFKYDIL